MDDRLTGISLLREAFSGPVALEMRRAQEIQQLLSRGIAGQDAPTVLRAIFGGPRLQTSIIGGGVTVIPLHGFIMQRGPAWLSYYGIRTLESFLEQFDAAMADDDVSHVVIHVDSPGGSVFGVPECAARIRAARGKKPITTVCDPLMASAAYHIGAAGDEIAITVSGMTGSIGVIWIHFDFSKALEDSGVKATIITHGRRKAETSELAPLGDEARAHIEQICADYGDRFDAAVGEYREIPADEVQSRFGEGAVFTAERAVSMGLADRVASLDDVLAELGVRRRPGSIDAAAAPHLKVAALSDPLAPIDLGSVEPGSVEVLQPMALDASSHVLERIAPPIAPAPPPANSVDTTAAAGAAAAVPTPAPAPAPTGQRTTVDEKTTAAPPAPAAPTAEQATANERDRQRRIRDLAEFQSDHVSPEQLDSYLQSGMSFEQVSDDITKRARAAAKPGVTPARPEGEAKKPAPRVARVVSSRQNEPGFRFGMIGLALAAACNERRQGRTLDPVAFLEEGGYPDIAAAVRSDRFDSGGAWVPENYLAGEFIELLRPASAVRSLNPRFVELTGGQASLPGMQGGATSYYKAEGNPGTTSGPTGRRVNLVSKELMTFVPLTYQLLRRATPDAGAMVRDDAVAASAQRSDLAFIRGDGTENSPKGLRYQAASANVLTMTATPDLADTTLDLGRLRLALQNSNVKMLRPGWMFAPRIENWLRTLRDGNGNFAFRDEMNDGTLDGYPFAVTTQIPTNLGGGTESEVYFADFADVVIGEEDAMQIDVFDQVTYYDGSAWQSAAQNNEIVLRIVEHHDIAVRYAESVAVLTGVTWGA